MKNKNPKNNIIKISHNLPYARILFIDKMISEGNFPSAPKIAREYEYQYRGTSIYKTVKNIFVTELFIAEVIALNKKRD